MIAPNSIESLSETYEARTFTALYRIPPIEVRELESMAIGHDEPAPPKFYDDGNPAQNDAGGGA